MLFVVVVVVVEVVGVVVGGVVEVVLGYLFVFLMTRPSRVVNLRLHLRQHTQNLKKIKKNLKN